MHYIQLHLQYKLLVFHFTDEDIEIQNELTCLTSKWQRWDSHQICESHSHDLNDQCTQPGFNLMWPGLL